MLLRSVLIAFAGLVCVSSTGCSSLGLTLWPSQFPLLSQTKEFAASSPLPNGLPHELAKQVVTDYYVEPGDRILIEPTALDSEFRSIGDQKVQVDGSVDLGEFGRLRVAGMTVESVEHAIETRIDEVNGDSEQINVQIVESNASQIYILGEVGSPGAYPLDGNETVLDGILAAGGLTSRASPCDIILVRPTDPCACRVVLPICYRQITQLGDVSSNYQMQPGDRIVVGSRTLTEELAIWKQTKGCDRCCGSRCVEKQPTRVGYMNRFLDWATPFPLPPKKKSDEEVAAEAEAASAAQSGNESGMKTGNAEVTSPRDGEPVALPPLSQDSDVFLPPGPNDSSLNRNWIDDVQSPRDAGPILSAEQLRIDLTKEF